MSDRPCERIGRWETCPIGARLTGPSVTETTTLLGVSRAAVCKVMSAFTDHGKTTAARRSS
jgi:hypothetical protein